MSVREFAFDDRAVRVGNADKVLFPDIGLTEGDLADYYYRVSGAILLHLRDRPVSMQRFPEGIRERGFYAKQTPDYFPDWVESVKIEVLETGEIQPQVVVNKSETLIYLVDQATITLHAWLSRTGRLQYPDKLIFDLDPPGDFATARDAARELHQLLDELELPSYLMTTGSRGLHVGVPLDGSAEFDAVRDFARNLAGLLASRAPDRLTTETRKNKRGGRLFLDYLRNAYAQTSVAPYSVRAKPGAPVATPLLWAELDDPQLTSQRFHVGNLSDRLGEHGDPWADFYDRGVSLAAARERLAHLMKQ